MSAAQHILHGITESIHFGGVEVLNDLEQDDFEDYEALAEFIQTRLPGMSKVVVHVDQVTGLHDGESFALKIDYLIEND